MLEELRDKEKLKKHLKLGITSFLIIAITLVAAVVLSTFLRKALIRLIVKSKKLFFIRIVNIVNTLFITAILGTSISFINSGYLKYISRINDNKSVTIKRAFKYSSSFSKYFISNSFTLILLELTIYNLMNNNVLVSLFLIALFIFLHLLYSEHKLILLNNPKIKLMDSLRQSEYLNRKYFKENLLLEIYLIDRYLLSIITLGIFYPYVVSERIKFYNSIKNR